MFIYVVYILAFISAVLMLFLGVVLMLPVSISTAKSYRFQVAMVASSGTLRPPGMAEHKPSLIDQILVIVGAIGILLLICCFLIIVVQYVRTRDKKVGAKTFKSILRNLGQGLQGLWLEYKF